MSTSKTGNKFARRSRPATASEVLAGAATQETAIVAEKAYFTVTLEPELAGQVAAAVRRRQLEEGDVLAHRRYNRRDFVREALAEKIAREHAA